MKRVGLLFLLLSSVTILLLGRQGVQAQSAQTSPLPSSPVPLDRSAQSADRLPAGGGPLLADDSQSVNVAIVPWSRLVLQSLRDGNWEIYAASGDGTNQVRLTNNDDADIEPEFNRGCDRIAFTSDRAGPFQIYVMNSNGSGVTQLTAAGADNVAPAWSPDGRLIAFESYRDGQAEIYVMGNDGARQRRLTTNSDYDGMPAWSPDGNTLVFASRRNGQYRIWQMEADGSNQVQLSNQPFSESPTWSPDGRNIAYDADADGDGWQELWLMSADGSNQRMVYDPSSSESHLVSAWARSWSADGRYVSFTRISFIYYYGYWFWTTAESLAWDTQSNSVFTIAGVDTDWYPAWQTTDAQAPISSILPLPTLAHPGLVVNWQGADLGDSGLAGYDVQIRQTGASTWTDWLLATTEVAAPFSAQPGTAFQFRVRARDNAFNVENWPEDAELSDVTFYNWMIEGMAHDTRGTPIMGAQAEVTPAALLISPSGIDGFYGSYVGALAESYSVDWRKPGYADMPDTVFGAGGDAIMRIGLLPADNVVAQAHFESENLTPWVAAGDPLPNVTTLDRYTGERAGFLGHETVFGMPELLEEDGVGHYRMATDGSGVLHVLWTHTHYETEVFYAQRDAAGNWSTPVVVPVPTNFQMKVETDGTVHVLWQGGTQEGLFYLRRELDGSWSSPALVVDTMAYSAALVVDPGGVPYVVWRELFGGSVRLSAYLPNGSWNEPQIVANVGGYAFQAAADDEGRLHIVWHQENGDLIYRQRTVTGQLLQPQSLPGTADLILPRLQLIVGPGGETVHVIWHDGSYATIHHSLRTAEGDWLYAQPLLPESTVTSTGDPKAVLDSGGLLHVVWSEIYGTESTVYHTQQRHDNSWSEPEAVRQISGYVPDVHLAADDMGVLHLVWKLNGVNYTSRHTSGQWADTSHIPAALGSNEPFMDVDAAGTPSLLWASDTGSLHFAGASIAMEASDVTISQAVLVPGEMLNPTLSFEHALGGFAAWSDTRFAVEVTQGISDTVVYASTGASLGWTQGWADLSPWQGEVVTVTFRLQQADQRQYARAMIDDVAVGSANPDVWLDLVEGPATAGPGDEVRFQLEVGNRGGVAAASVMLTMTLDANLIFVAAEPAPTGSGPTLVWSLGDLAARSGSMPIVITATVTNQVDLGDLVVNSWRIGTTTPELEVQNNELLATMMVGRFIHLPMVMRVTEP